MTKRFDGKDGKVIYFEVDEVSNAYPKGTLKVEACIYPIEAGRYSSFIYTSEPISLIENSLEKIADKFLTDGKNSYNVKEISDTISVFINPVFPQKNK